MVFPSDEGGELITSTEFSVRIEDDDVNESQEQYFVIRVELADNSASQFGGAGVSSNFTVCTIRDNDGEFSILL